MRSQKQPFLTVFWQVIEGLKVQTRFFEPLNFIKKEVVFLVWGAAFDKSEKFLGFSQFLSELLFRGSRTRTAGIQPALEESLFCPPDAGR